MKTKSFYIELESPKIIYWLSRLFSGTNGKAKAMALWPFIFISNTIHPNMKPFVINHELIHFQQQKEELFLGSFIMRFFECIYLRVWKKKTSFEAYFESIREQEAYDNMFDLDYLNKRESYAHYKKYYTSEPIQWVDYIKKVLTTEGYTSVYDWYDPPGAVYESHLHKGRVSLYIIKGSIIFSGGIEKTIGTGDRLDIPADVEHSAIVGSLGCHYVVGEEIEGDS